MISGDDSNRYQFDIIEWKGNQLPKSGLKVDFSIEGEHAKAIYAIASNAGSSKKVAAALFAFFLGAFGAHKFYLGYTKPVSYTHLDVYKRQVMGPSSLEILKWIDKS